MDDLFLRASEILDSLNEFKRSLCKTCKEQKPLNERRLCDVCEAEKVSTLAAARIPNGSGYIYVYDDEGKLVSEARTVMEGIQGRALRSYEVVLRRNNQRADNSPDNLLLGLKNGTPIGNIRCNHCGTIGDISLVEEIPSTDD